MLKFYTNVFRNSRNIFHVGYENGEKFFRKESFQPHLGVPSKEKTGWKTINGENVKRVDFESFGEMYEFKKTYRDILPVYDDIDITYQFINETYIGTVKYDLSLIEIMYYDLEILDLSSDKMVFPDPEKAEIPIVLITAKLSKSGDIYVFGTKDFDSENMETKYDGTLRYIKCKHEKDLIRKFCRFFQMVSPDILSGWNIDNFDTPYLINRTNKIFGENASRNLSLMCYGFCPTTEVNWFNNQKEFRNKLPGITQFDLFRLYKKRYPLESYKLDVVANHELKQKKVDFGEHKNLLNLFKNDYQKGVEYGAKDSELVYLIEKKLGIINTYINLGYLHKCLYEDTLHQTRAWDQLIYVHLSKKGIMIPPKRRSPKTSYVGAYVKNIIPGIYRWLVSYDINSMYPSLIMQFNISPETILSQDSVDTSFPEKKFFDKDFKNEEDNILSVNGARFTKTFVGFLAELMEEIYTERKKAKKKSVDYRKLLGIANKEKNEVDILKYGALEKFWKGQDEARKGSLNSAYGATANEFFRYYDVRLSEAITLTGQYVIIEVGKRVEEALQKKYNIKSNINLYGDTDSCYFDMSTIVEKLWKDKTFEEKVDLLDDFAEKEIQKIINKVFLEIKEKFNCNRNKMIMKREVIAEAAIFKGKKHYSMLVVDDEGARYEKPKLKSKGMQLIQSSTPTVLKDFFKEALTMMMKDPDSIPKLIIDVKEKFMQFSPEEIAFPRSVNNLQKYHDRGSIFKKGCPIAVRGALIHNKCIKDKKIDVEEISNAEKVKFIYMKVPNIYYNSNIVAFIGDFPYDIKYIDYELQFKKSFLAIIEELCKVVGISSEKAKQLSMEDLF